MPIDPAYQAALDYLYRFVDYSLTHQQNLAPELFDLSRMRVLLEALGNPQDAYPTIHVAGTKGKGSICALTAAALQAQGYKVGLYTSPHLVDFEERFQINGQPIVQQDLVELVDLIKPHVSAVPRLTTFEITTALAFWYFARQQVDIAVIEVGLGGRLDATNVITPLVAVISSISFDHTAVLGNTLAQIAGEKGGIIKPGVPLVIAPQKDEPRLVFIKMAAERQAKLLQVGIDLAYAPLDHNLDGQRFQVWRPGMRAEARTLQIPLLGMHQIENAATAYAALGLVNQSGLQVRPAAIESGFANTSWPGRFEIVQKQPPLVLDSAHNTDSAARLGQTLDDVFPGQPVTLVLGVSADKDITGMLAALQARLSVVVTTQSGHPRAMDPDQLAELVRDFGLQVESRPDAAAALDRARQLAGPEGLLLVTGSVFVVASARAAWLGK
ncbi:MAG: bifunctional folylpolyglutamate synthase/dihydrofolate synthase [Anaerolineales bacterium]|nr:bifunctional folylpolyglutamate synthase/dihydrofolate synthase [Anaerolineales bacterium]